MRRDVHKRDSKTIIALVCLCLFFLTSVITQYDNLVENHPYSYSQHSSKKHSLRYTPHEWINITSDADFSKYNFTGSGLKSDPYQIANLEIICNESYGIRLINTTKYVTISNCYVNTPSGIFIQNASPGSIKIEDFIIESCNNGGIILMDCFNVYITNITSISNLYGVYGINCDNTEVRNSYFTRCKDYGIPFKQSQNVLYSNNIYANNYGGFRSSSNFNSTIINETVIGDEYHCLIKDDMNTTIRDCSIFNSTEDGVYIDRSDYCIITENHLETNTRYGVYVRGSLECMIYNNSFNANHNGSIASRQGYDNTDNNNWYHPELQLGNRWSDWSGEGYYFIDGPGDAMDLYPSFYGDSPPTSTEPNNRITAQPWVIGAIIGGLLLFIGIVGFIVIVIRRKSWGKPQEEHEIESEIRVQRIKSKKKTKEKEEGLKIETLEQPHCYHCDCDIPEGVKRCPECGKYLKQCYICKLPVYFNQKATRCPKCRIISHYSHFYEWAKVHGTCPHCSAALKLSDLE